MKPDVPLCHPDDHCARLLAGARGRARKQGVTYDLGAETFLQRWREQGGRCEVSGLPFTEEEFAQALVRHPFRPSIDRVDPGGPYVWPNARLVCVCANFSMNEWGLDTLVRLADAVVDHQRQATIRASLVAIWRARLEGRVEEALAVLPLLDEFGARRYRRRIAGLRRSLSLGRQGLAVAGAKASATSKLRIAAADGERDQATGRRADGPELTHVVERITPANRHEETDWGLPHGRGVW